MNTELVEDNASAQQDCFRKNSTEQKELKIIHFKNRNKN